MRGLRIGFDTWQWCHIHLIGHMHGSAYNAIRHMLWIHLCSPCVFLQIYRVGISTDIHTLYHVTSISGYLEIPCLCMSVHKPRIYVGCHNRRSHIVVQPRIQDPSWPRFGSFLGYMAHTVTPSFFRCGHSVKGKLIILGLTWTGFV